MPIYIYDGSMGSGKTLSAIRQAYNLKDSNTQIKSNVTLNKNVFKNFTPLTIEDIKNYRNWKYDNMIVIMDELHTILDSRRSGSNINIMLSYWFTQTRKRNVHVIATTQFIHQIDKRIRDNCDYVINCECIKTPNKKSKYSYKGMSADFWIKNMTFDRSKNRYNKTIMFYANDYFHAYDTYQVIDFYGNNNINDKLKKIHSYIDAYFKESKHQDKLLRLIKLWKKSL